MSAFYHCRAFCFRLRRLDKCVTGLAAEESPRLLSGSPVESVSNPPRESERFKPDCKFTKSTVGEIQARLQNGKSPYADRRHIVR